MKRRILAFLWLLTVPAYLIANAVMEDGVWAIPGVVYFVSITWVTAWALIQIGEWRD